MRLNEVIRLGPKNDRTVAVEEEEEALSPPCEDTWPSASQEESSCEKLTLGDLDLGLLPPPTVRK